MALEIKKSKFLAKSLSKYKNDKKVMKAFKDFVEFKSEKPKESFGSKDYKYNGVLGDFYHAGLTFDVMVLYKVKGDGLYLYAVVDHDDSGTSNPPNMNRQKSLRDKLQQQTFESKLSFKGFLKEQSLRESKQPYQIKIGRDDWRDLELDADSLKQIADELDGPNIKDGKYSAATAIFTLVVEYHCGPHAARGNPDNYAVDEDFTVTQLRDDILKISYHFTNVSKQNHRRVEGTLTIMPGN